MTGPFADARLYLIADLAGLAAVPWGEVDVLQLRDKLAGRAELRHGAKRTRERCDAHGMTFIINDDPHLAAACGADGVHLGQDDMVVERAREIVGPEAVIGLSTHTAGQIEAAAGVDYIGVGPVFATPTKPGYLPVGLELVRYAAAHARVPFFAIGGIDAGNVDAVRAAGGLRVAVVRAIGDAANPTAAARALREVGVGAT